MNLETANFLFQIFTAVVSACGVGVGVYAGIKSDLTVAKIKAELAVESAKTAHTRIDEILKGS